MHALILADGDAPTRPQLDRRLARLGRRGRARHRGRRRRTPCRSRSAWRSTCGSATATRSTRPMLDALAAAGIPLERSRPGQGRIGHRAGDPRGAPPRGGRGSSSSARWAVRGSTTALANIGLLALPALAGRPAMLLDARLADLADPGARARTAARSSAGWPAGAATSSRCCRSGRASRASPPTASPTRCATSRWRRARRAACPTSGPANPARASTVRRGLAADRGIAC